MAQDFVGLPGLDAFIQGKINQAITEEREACAVQARQYVNRHGWLPVPGPITRTAIGIAAAIRARSATKTAEGDSQEFVRLGIAAARVVAACESAECGG